MREIIGDLAIIGTGAALLVLFVLILVNGRLWVCEENLPLLYVELAGSALLVILGAERLINDIRRRKK